MPFTVLQCVNKDIIIICACNILEPFCPMKHDLYITHIHVSYRETGYTSK